MTLESRFWSKVEVGPPDECWLWTAALNEHGYGVMRPEGQRTGPTAKAHRVSWEIAHGEIPDGLAVLHRCDNPPCVNPQHLFLGTQADNVTDMHAKGRGNIGSANGQASLTERDVIEIRNRVARGERQKDLCAEFGITKGTMSHLVSGKTWAHV